MYNACHWKVLVNVNLPLCTRATKEKKYQTYYFVRDKNTMNIKAHKGYVHQKTALLEYDSKLRSSIVKLSGTLLDVS